MPKRTNKRFLTEEAVIKRIDELHVGAKRWMMEAEEKEQKFKMLVKAAAEIEEIAPGRAAKLRDDAHYTKQQVMKLRKKSERALDVTAKKLGEKLSILRTNMLIPDLPKDIPQRLV